MVTFLKLKTKDLKRSREKEEERRGNGRVWSEGRLVFIGEVRCLPAFVNATTLYYYFNIPAFVNAVMLYYYYNIISLKHFIIKKILLIKNQKLFFNKILL